MGQEAAGQGEQDRGHTRFLRRKSMNTYIVRFRVNGIHKMIKVMAEGPASAAQAVIESMTYIYMSPVKFLSVRKAAAR